MKLRPLWIVLIVMFVVLLAGGIWLASTARRFEAALGAVEIGEVDLAQVADGQYTGSYDAAGVIKAEVRVTVSGGRITGIELLRHDHGQGDGAKDLPDKVVAAQSLAIDGVSGATYSSKVILKAIEVALTGK